MASKAWELEKDFQRWLRKKIGVWSTSVEYGLGGDAGFPDMVFPDPQGHGSEARVVYEAPYFVELKIGRVIDVGNKLVVSEVRAEQIAWHRGARAAGLKTAMLVGVPDYELEWVVYPVRAEFMPNWKDGYELTRNGHPLNNHGVPEILNKERLFAWLRMNT